MAFIDLKDLQEKEVVPGFHARFVHTENMTFAYFRIDKGASVPNHSHLNEQVTNVIEGELELNVNGEIKIMKPGNAAVIPGNIPHSAKAITDCNVIDVFYPIREDYKSKFQ
jgi:quercetin dioxygenase-like cupin family protein